MDRSVRNVRGLVDSFLGRLRGLSAGAFLVLFLSFFCVSNAYADSCSDTRAALTGSLCTFTGSDSNGHWHYECQAVRNGSNTDIQSRRRYDTGPYAGSCVGNCTWISTFTVVGYCTSTGAAICSTLPQTHIYASGKVLNGYSFTEVATDGLGASVQCAMAATVSGSPVWNPYSQIWQTYVTVTPTGQTADTLGVKDGAGSPVADVVNPGTYADQSTTPSVCGGGSCYNSASDQYCASSGGSQYCVSGGSARTSSGGCSGSSAVVCGGSPSAPLPTQSQVPDPATQIVQSDKYTQADATTGATLPVVVNIYKGSISTSTPTSGQKAGDSGPASSSSSPSSGSSYAGGSDCNTPPVCSGDPATCGAARTQWATTCQVHKDLAGTGAPSDFDALKTKYSQSDVWTDASATTDSSVGGQANAGNYDQSGFGFGTSCPLHDIPVSMGSLGSFSIPLQDKCYVGTWLRALVIGSALFAAAIITAGGRGGM